MKERPILFSGPMVRAILDGRKTQTRRLVKLHRVQAVDRAPTGARSITCQYGVPGDRLWVRETWKSSTYSCEEEPQIDEHACEAHCRQTYIYYAATPRVGFRARPDRERIRYLDESTPLSEWYERGWKSSRYMPRWASRITLEVVAVRVERLQEISEDDARAEGVRRIKGAGGAVYPGTGAYRRPGSYRHAFQTLWDKLNGKRAPWELNPFVWVVSFRKVEGA